MTSKEWLSVMQQAEDFNHALTPLIIKYGELLLSESALTEEKGDVYKGFEQEFKELSLYLDDLSQCPKDAGHTWIAFTDKFSDFKKRILAALPLSPVDNQVEAVRFAEWVLKSRYRHDGTDCFRDYEGTGSHQFTPQELYTEFINTLKK